MISAAPRLPLDWTASLMVDPDDLEQVSLPTVVNPIRRDRPSVDAPAVTQDDFPPHEGPVASRPMTSTSRARSRSAASRLSLAIDSYASPRSARA